MPTNTAITDLNMHAYSQGRHHLRTLELRFSIRSFWISLSFLLFCRHYMQSTFLFLLAIIHLHSTSMTMPITALSLWLVWFYNQAFLVQIFIYLFNFALSAECTTNVCYQPTIWPTSYSRGPVIKSKSQLFGWMLLPRQAGLFFFSRIRESVAYIFYRSRQVWGLFILQD